MRRILFAVLVSATALAVVPAMSLADHGRGEHQQREHGREHARHHDRRHERRHHHKVRELHLGQNPVTAGHDGTAGTIKSFDGTVLTITLTNGSDVSGTVTDFTRIKCEAPEQMVGDDHGRDAGGDNSGPGSRGDSGDQGDNHGDQGDQGDDHGDDNGNEQMCSTADLKPNTVVQDAELRISGSGSFWEEVELAPQP